MSLLLQQKQIVPDLIISSPAVRAISTALIFSRTLGYDPARILLNNDLYQTTVKDYNRCIGAIGDQYRRVMLFGHNPVITDCLNGIGNKFIEDMPICGIAGIG